MELPRKKRKRFNISFNNFNRYFLIDKEKNKLTFVIIPTICLEIDNTYRESLHIDDVEYGKVIQYNISIEWLGWYLKISTLRMLK